MTEHTLKLRRTEQLTHDTYRLVTTRPEGYGFVPGQANHWGIERGGFRDAAKPFTITSLPDEDHLEFVIKSYPTDQYPEHDGFTELIPQLEPGEAIYVDDAGGDIRDEGRGLFVAGGAGVTPFIPILKDRQRRGELDGSTLLYSNKTEADIILRELWEEMEGLETVFTLTEEAHSRLPKTQTDTALLQQNLRGHHEKVYVCGPPPMMKSVIADLRAMGVEEDRIVVEEKWLA
jgi:ferredoxin-NADP reductase